MIMITNWVANRKMKELLSSISVSMGEDVFEMKPEQLNRLFSLLLDKLKIV